MIKETMIFSTRTILTSEVKITLGLATPKNELLFFSLKLRVQKMKLDIREPPVFYLSNDNLL